MNFLETIGWFLVAVVSMLMVSGGLERIREELVNLNSKLGDKS